MGEINFFIRCQRFAQLAAKGKSEAPLFAVRVDAIVRLAVQQLGAVRYSPECRRTHGGTEGD